MGMKTDCLAYRKSTRECKALKQPLCADEIPCPFYMNITDKDMENESISLWYTNRGLSAPGKRHRK